VWRHQRLLSRRPWLCRRESQRGQAIPIIAVMAVPIFGFAALAVDLSINTHSKRNIQNVTDAAALAGASELQASPVTQANREQGAIDAFGIMYDRLGLSVSGSSKAYFTTLVTNACGSSTTQCTVSLTLGNYSMTVASPPTGSTQGFNGSSHTQYLETKVVQSSTNSLGKIVGQATSTETGHSIAYHSTPNQPYGFALWAQQYVQSGNAEEIITGNIYAAQFLDPQSSGQATICAQGGGIVLGAPQDPYASSNNTQGSVTPMPHSARSVTFVNGTNGNGTLTCDQGPQGGILSQTIAEGCSNIPNVNLPSGSYVDDSSYSQTLPSGITTLGTTLACVSNPALTTPALNAPPLPSSWASGGSAFANAPTYTCSANNTGLAANGHYQPGVYQCPLTVDHPLDPGTYVIEHKHGSSGNDVDLTQSVTSSCTASELATGYTVCLDGVTFYAETNSQGDSPTIGVSSKVVVNQTAACTTPTRASNWDCVYPIYSPIGVSTTVNIQKNGTDWVLQGTIYDPSGAVSIGQNARVQITGQAIVQQWNDQSGFHPDPSITFSSNASAPQTEQLRLVE
jgi:Flp pilus assembly protein TadG